MPFRRHALRGDVFRRLIVISATLSSRGSDIDPTFEGFHAN
jgi:hypothetical protein